MDANELKSVSDANVSKDGIAVEAGQVWRDLDRRMGGRCCKVMSLYDGHAKMRRCTDAGVELATKDTRVAVRRMHKGATGWELVKLQG